MYYVNIFVFFAQGSIEKEPRIEEIENDMNQIRRVICELKLENKKIKSEKKVMVNDIEKLSGLVKYYTTASARKCEICSQKEYDHIEYKRILDSSESNLI